MCLGQPLVLLGLLGQVVYRALLGYAAWKEQARERGAWEKAISKATGFREARQITMGEHLDTDWLANTGAVVHLRKSNFYRIIETEARRHWMEEGRLLFLNCLGVKEEKQEK